MPASNDRKLLNLIILAGSPALPDRRDVPANLLGVYDAVASYRAAVSPVSRRTSSAMLRQRVADATAAVRGQL